MAVSILKMRTWGLRGQESLVLTLPEPGRLGGQAPGQGLTVGAMGKDCKASSLHLSRGRDFP